MNRKQRIVVYVCLAIMVAMLLFPPMRVRDMPTYAGHAFFTVSRIDSRRWDRAGGRGPSGYIALDLYRLAMQMMMVALVGAGVFIMLREQGDRK